ncbi:MAG: response regulator [bacterium]
MPPINPQPKKILIVEDEPDARQIFIDILGGAGFEIDGATEGDDALLHMSQKKYDLILLDIVMPQKDGIQTLTEVKKFPGKYGDMKIVMLTNIGGDLAIDKALKLGADGYMLKSETEPDDLVAIVNKYLELS